MAPEASYQIAEDAFAGFVDTDTLPEQLCTGCIWTEGPVWFDETETLLFSDIPNNRMMQWNRVAGASEFLNPAEFTNGHIRDHDGHLVSCEHGGRRVIRRLADGTVEVIADKYDGKRLNSPNDLVMTSDGAIWFTDPPYGIASSVEGYEAKSELGVNYVFRVDPDTSELTIVADDFDKPNGLAFSADEKILYIADSGAINGASDPGFNAGAPHHIRAFDVVDGRTLANSRLFVDIKPGVPDGLRVDTEGFVWTSAADGVHCYAPDSTLYGKILLPEVVANLTFGGPGGTTIFIAASTSIYTVATTRHDAKSTR
ncbi:MAG: SMP-30/gluconolactonase/LRE family protein [Alphaproteobacteria bacterium]|nr:SMP-30/gluconolactonase/LRE family protein [Alphaproteobacteria bacterium]